MPTMAVTRSREAIIAELERIGARAQGKWHAARFPPRMRHLPPFDEVIPDALAALLADLAGDSLRLAEPRPQPLLTAPHGPSWSVPHLGWNLDVASPSRDVMPGIQVFVLLGDLAPKAGATLAIAGSHRLHRPSGGKPLSAHQVLKADPAYRELFSPGGDRQRFLDVHTVDGVAVQVVEMCGEAGDAYLMDMRTIHAPASNPSRNPRMMLTSRYLVGRERR